MKMVTEEEAVEEGEVVTKKEEEGLEAEVEVEEDPHDQEELNSLFNPIDLVVYT
jgi:hypothetical protein